MPNLIVLFDQKKVKKVEPIFFADCLEICDILGVTVREHSVPQDPKLNCHIDAAIIVAWTGFTDILSITNISFSTTLKSRMPTTSWVIVRERKKQKLASRDLVAISGELRNGTAVFEIRLCIISPYLPWKANCKTIKTTTLLPAP